MKKTHSVKLLPSLIHMHATAGSISVRNVASLPDGRAVQAWTLAGAGGLQIEALTFGGIVTRLLVPDRVGNLVDVVLGFTKADSYYNPHPYFGAITGRVAGRLSGASFSLDGKTYRLPSNEGVNHLHGGIEGFDKKVWNATPVSRADESPSLRLSYISPAGEEGYPGTLEMSVIYTALPDNTFQIDTYASTDEATPFNPTHHSYFNLAGEGAGSIADHQLQICSDRFSLTDDRLLHVGQLVDLAGEPNDFNQPRLLGDASPGMRELNGDLYLIRKTSDEIKHHSLVRAARISHAGSRRMLTVRTNEQYLQLYTGIGLDGTLTGKSGRTYERSAGLCLECQGHSNGPNQHAMGDIILRPGQKFHRTTQYSFSTF